MNKKPKALKQPKDSSLSKSEQRMLSYANNRIDKITLEGFIKIHQNNRIKDPDCGVHKYLGEMIIIIVKKTLGSGNWKGYDTETKLQMEELAYIHILKYIHNYNSLKAKDPYAYACMIITNACIQILKKRKLEWKHFTNGSIDTILNQNADMDQGNSIDILDREFKMEMEIESDLI